MRRTAAALVLIGALAVTAAAGAGGARRAGPTKLTIWVGWSAGHELTTFKQAPAADDLRADRTCEEADGPRQERLDQGGGLRPRDRLLREHAGSLGRAVRRLVARRERQVRGRRRSGVGAVGDVAEEPRRLVR